MPEVKFGAKPIDGKATQFESGAEITLLLTFTGANPTTSTVLIDCPVFAQNPAIATVPVSTSTKARVIKVNATISGDAGTYTATIQSALGATVGATNTASITVVNVVTVEFAAELIGKSPEAPYEPGDVVELQLEATGANKNTGSVEIHCEAFTRNPVVVKIPAAPRIGSGSPRKIKSMPVVLKGAPNIYDVELRENNNCGLGTKKTDKLTLVAPVTVSFATPPFKEGLSPLTPEQKVTLCLQIDRAPKKDISVTVRCPGFGKSTVMKDNLSNFAFKIKKKHDPAKPLEESINLLKEEGHYQAVITVPTDYVIGNPDKFEFDIGPKRVQAWLAQQPFLGVLADKVKKDELRDVQIHLSEPPEADIKLTLSCPGMEPKKHEFTVKKGQASPYTIPQKFKLVGDPGTNVMSLEATDTILKNPVDVRPGNATALFFLPWPPGPPVLEFGTPPHAAPLNGAVLHAVGPGGAEARGGGTALRGVREDHAGDEYGAVCGVYSGEGPDAGRPADGGGEAAGGYRLHDSRRAGDVHGERPFECVELRDRAEERSGDWDPQLSGGVFFAEASGEAEVR
jgi:hypothetical protein